MATYIHPDSSFAAGNLADLYQQYYPRADPFLSSSQAVLTGQSPSTLVVNPVHTSAIMQNLQLAIDTSHTTRTQRARAQTLVEPPLSGSLDPFTGDFHATADQHRLRTQHACERCRKLKRKCTGERPSCQACIKQGGGCEYGELRQRGPNKEGSDRLKKDLPPPGITVANPQDVQNVMAPAIVQHPSQPQQSGLDFLSLNVTTGEGFDNEVPHPQFSSPPQATDIPSGHLSLQNSPRIRNNSLFVTRRPRAATVASGSVRAASRPSSTAGVCTTLSSRRARPPSIDLADLRDGLTRMLADEYARNGPQGSDAVEEPATGDTLPTAPLPPYLVESYTQVALNSLSHQVAAAAPTHDTTLGSYDAHAESGSPRTCSESSSSSDAISFSPFWPPSMLPAPVPLDDALSLECPDETSYSPAISASAVPDLFSESAVDDMYTQMFGTFFYIKDIAEGTMDCSSSSTHSTWDDTSVWGECAA
ncbi:hypothetical protein C8Q80DRAFT_261047 [Daedaleopsis nitida]|nr:hypothetical protein C8Q80DRAFT_261047 [Daedaleopsis nitida]